MTFTVSPASSTSFFQRIEGQLQPWSKYLDVQEGEKGVRVLTRFVSPATFRKIEHAIEYLGGTLLTIESSRGDHKATWWIPENLHRPSIQSEEVQ